MRGGNAHEEALIVNRNRVGIPPMIDTLSLLLAHFLLGYVAFRMFSHPDLNEEPTQVSPETVQAERAAIQALWQAVFA